MAATNYAIEGVTGDWSALVCSKDTYEQSFAEGYRSSAMKWLKLHAKYDDRHPWEALDIICTLMGCNPSARGVELIRSRVQTSYNYMRVTLDHCLDANDIVSQPVPLDMTGYPAERVRRA
jgi:pyrroloquinoline quinone (PQQ) biosynthesis protein C